MDDRQIIELYLNRDENALALTAEKYADHCRYIAGGIIADPQAVEDCLREACQALWNSIPPRRPRDLSVYIGKAVRNIALAKWKQSPPQVRKLSQVMPVMAELGQCIPDAEPDGQPLDRAALIQVLNGFLGGLDPRTRQIFMARYWYMRTPEQICSQYGEPAEAICASLEESRALLRQQLTFSLKASNILSCLEKVESRFISEAAPGSRAPADAKKGAAGSGKKPPKKLMIIAAAVAAIGIIAAVILFLLPGGDSGKKDPDRKDPASSAGSLSSDDGEKEDLMGEGDAVTAGSASFSIVQAISDGDTLFILTRANASVKDIFLIPQGMTRDSSTTTLNGLYDIPEGTVEQYAAYLGRQLAAVSLEYRYDGQVLEGTQEYTYDEDGSLYLRFTAPQPQDGTDSISCRVSFYQDLEEASDRQTAEFAVGLEAAPEAQVTTFSSFDASVITDTGILLDSVRIESSGMGFVATFSFTMEEGRDIRFQLTDANGNTLPAIPGANSASFSSNSDGSYSVTVSCQKSQEGQLPHFIVIDSDRGMEYGPYSCG